MPSSNKDGNLTKPGEQEHSFPDPEVTQLPKNWDTPPVMEDTVVIQTQTSGPLPDGATLEHYERVLEGAADRVFCMAEQSAQHRRDMQRLALELKARSIARGQWMAVATMFSAMVTSTVLGIMVSPWAGGILATLSIGAVVTAFLKAKWGGETHETKSQSGNDQT